METKLSIVIFADKTYKIVEGQTREFENDKYWFLTMPLSDLAEFKGKDDGWIKFADNPPDIDEFIFMWIGSKIPVLCCYKGDGKFLDFSLNDIWDVKEDGIEFYSKLPAPPIK